MLCAQTADAEYFWIIWMLHIVDVSNLDAFAHTTQL